MYVPLLKAVSVHYCKYFERNNSKRLNLKLKCHLLLVRIFLCCCILNWNVQTIKLYDKKLKIYENTSFSYRSIIDGSPYINSDGKGIVETEVVVVNGHQETQRQKIHIVKSLFKTFWAPFLSSSFFKFFYDLLQFVNPMLLK